LKKKNFKLKKPTNKILKHEITWSVEICWRIAVLEAQEMENWTAVGSVDSVFALADAADFAVMFPSLSKHFGGCAYSTFEKTSRLQRRMRDHSSDDGCHLHLAVFSYG
jgi:hypothetical protein